MCQAGVQGPGRVTSSAGGVLAALGATGFSLASTRYSVWPILDAQYIRVE